LNILSIDVGSYSIKFLEAFVEKKRVTILNTFEVIISEYRKGHPEITELYDVQASAIRDYVDKLEGTFRIVFQAPSSIVTARFLTVPVKNKKKAEMMVPFQLEEDIPFSLSEAHIASNLSVEGKVTRGLVSIINKETFNEYYNTLNSNKIVPYILTYEASAFSDFIHREQIMGPICIMDIGHTMTKAYFFHDGELVSINTSYVAGSDIDEAIVKHYGISQEEAVTYKHRNCFFLTENQYKEVNDDQKEFGFMMHDVFSPLINEYRRWELGYRVNYASKVNQVFICGGVSNIKNITNYLTLYLDTRVSRLDVFQKIDNLAIDSMQEKARFTLSQLMATASRGKSKLINLLTGDFVQIVADELPLHSITFIASRLAAVTCMLLMLLGVETLVLKQEYSDLNKKIVNNYLKADYLELSRKDRRTFKRKPESLIKKLKGRKKRVSQEVKTIQAASRIDSISPLVKLSNTVGSFKEVTMLTFDSDETGFVKGELEAEDIKYLNSLDASLKNAGFKDYYSNLNETKKTLTIEFNYEL
jgi:general secretion pathway protein L